MNKNETITAEDSVSAAVAVGACLEAPLDLEGRYRAVCVGPVEKYRDLYVQHRDALWAAKKVKDLEEAALHQGFLNLIPMEEKWEDDIKNLVTTVGKNLALDTILAGSAYTAACYVGLISATPTPAAGDTMASHGGWTEVGGTNAPTYTGPRKTPSWSAASAGSKATSAAMAFAITGTGTVGGCFLVFGSGAASTIDSTTGVLYSAGAFTQGNRAVVNGDTINVSYTASA